MSTQCRAELLQEKVIMFPTWSFSSNYSVLNTEKLPKTRDVKKQKLKTTWKLIYKNIWTAADKTQIENTDPIVHHGGLPICIVSILQIAELYGSPGKHRTAMNRFEGQQLKTVQVHTLDQTVLPSLWNSFVGTGIHNEPVPPAENSSECRSFTSLQMFHTHIYIYIESIHMNIVYNVKLVLINPSLLINPQLPDPILQ